MQFLHLCKYPFKVKPSVMRFQSSVDNDRCSLKAWSALNHEHSIFLIADTDDVIFKDRGHGHRRIWKWPVFYLIEIVRSFWHDAGNIKYESFKCTRIITGVILIYVLVFLIQTLFAEYQSRSALSGMSRDLFSVPRVYTPDF